ncbi:MAG TPA: type II secretion system F family protein [Acidimicrobiales bacterium]|nr:type II secretion system F family protein [Acidimicrobiales bacterium]
MRLALVASLALWAGTTLVLSNLRWFARPPLARRLRPYVPGGLATISRGGLLSIESFRDVVGPLSRSMGERLAKAFGVSEELEVRLERIHSPLDVTAFRVRQVGRMTAALGVAGLAALAIRPPAPIGLLMLLGAPVLAFLLVEQQVGAASSAWQRRLVLELPVVAEQLAMLLSAGFSLSSALNRLASRGHGACARDLRRVCGRIRQGLSEIEALREWAAVAGVGALDRLVPVLALNREASDLGRLISEEARAIRRDVQRELVETMERRSQQVWIPVTVATLIPGVIFLAIPFIEALRLFSGS